jgi:Bacterial regulatory proteins, luxR family
LPGSSVVWCSARSYLSFHKRRSRKRSGRPPRRQGLRSQSRPGLSRPGFLLRLLCGASPHYDETAVACTLLPKPPRDSSLGLGDWVAQGKSNKEIGDILELSPRTVQKHLEHIYRKIPVESRTAAAAKAYESGLVASKQIGRFQLFASGSKKQIPIIYSDGAFQQGGMRIQLLHTPVTGGESL